jgi:hypothetical protein
MRKRFEQQFVLGQIPIDEVEIPVKGRDSIYELMAGLKKIFITPEYNQRIFEILEAKLNKDKKNTGRPGMDLWQIFVLAQLRLCLNTSYEMLHHLANNDSIVRRIMGVEKDFGYERIEFEYQNIYDNLTLLDDETIRELNTVIVEFGHEVFKKKEGAALRLKTDSFVVESNVHFPTDYNLLWDCARKCLDVVARFLGKYEHINGWRKIANWRCEIKGLMRELGKASSSGGKNKEQRVRQAAMTYLIKAKTLIKKLEKEMPLLPMEDTVDISNHLVLERFVDLMKKHIDLLERRVIKGEQIPHQEKLFSVFEEYTEWVKKGKLVPNVELGKKLAITTDQYHLIVDYQVMENEQDRDIVIKLADRLLAKWPIDSWSFDKGFWNKENKELLQLEIANVVMPKLGKRTHQEQEQEHARSFKRLKNAHSAIESNINELEHRGLDRCPDRGYHHYRSYIGLGVCTYNLKKIGRAILEAKRSELKAKQFLKTAA